MRHNPVLLTIFCIWLLPGALYGYVMIPATALSMLTTGEPPDFGHFADSGEVSSSMMFVGASFILGGFWVSLWLLGATVAWLVIKPIQFLASGRALERRPQ